MQDIGRISAVIWCLVFDALRLQKVQQTIFIVTQTTILLDNKVHVPEHDSKSLKQGLEINFHMQLKTTLKH